MSFVLATAWRLPKALKIRTDTSLAVPDVVMRLSAKRMFFSSPAARLTWTPSAFDSLTTRSMSARASSRVIISSAPC